MELLWSPRWLHSCSFKCKTRMSPWGWGLKGRISLWRTVWEQNSATAGFLNSGTPDILDQVILCCVGALLCSGYLAAQLACTYQVALLPQPNCIQTLLMCPGGTIARSWKCMSYKNLILLRYFFLCNWWEKGERKQYLLLIGYELGTIPMLSLST